jgi:hypothetical protein
VERVGAISENQQSNREESTTADLITTNLTETRIIGIDEANRVFRRKKETARIGGIIVASDNECVVAKHTKMTPLLSGLPQQHNSLCCVQQAHNRDGCDSKWTRFRISTG